MVSYNVTHAPPGLNHTDVESSTQSRARRRIALAAEEANKILKEGLAGQLNDMSARLDELSSAVGAISAALRKAQTSCSQASGSPPDAHFLVWCSYCPWMAFPVSQTSLDIAESSLDDSVLEGRVKDDSTGAEEAASNILDLFDIYDARVDQGVQTTMQMAEWVAQATGKQGISDHGFRDSSAEHVGVDKELLPVSNQVGDVVVEAWQGAAGEADQCDWGVFALLGPSAISSKVRKRFKELAPDSRAQPLYGSACKEGGQQQANEQAVRVERSFSEEKQAIFDAIARHVDGRMKADMEFMSNALRTVAEATD